MLDFPTVWTPYSPDSLLDISINYCVRNPESFCTYNNELSGYELRDGISLPREICERMFTIAKAELTDETFVKFITIFNDPSSTRLTTLDLSKSIVNDRTFALLCRHKIRELDVTGCKRLTRISMRPILDLGEILVSLTIGDSIHVLFNRTPFIDWGEEARFQHRYMGLLSPKNQFPTVRLMMQTNPIVVMAMPALRRLVVHDVEDTDDFFILNALIASTKNLTYLNLARSSKARIKDQPLQSLVLWDVPKLPDMISAIVHVKTLRHLDISNSSNQVKIYDNPNQVLSTIASSLVNLVSLDISGTNLAGGRSQERNADPERAIEEDEMLTDIPGLASRVNNPLEFLGLLNCSYDACYRHHIPAKKVAGNANEEQVLVACQVYISRERMIKKVLNDLFQIFRYSTCKNIKLALDVVVEAMKRHLHKRQIQVSGSAILFYIVKSDDREALTIKIRRTVIKLIIDAMFLHHGDVTMLRNGCLTLIHFKIPEDVFFDYERLARILLIIVSQDNQEEFVLRIAVYLLNSLACQVDGVEKRKIGDYGTIEIMLKVIEKRLERLFCDEVMETAWSTMWNVTDETPINCSRFLDNKGMDLFIGCLNAFPRKPELLRNMMGLLGNVAEVPELRHHLMMPKHLDVFNFLLESKSDGIEVSYNAAGILSHIASDGPETWTNVTGLRRVDVLRNMELAIDSWNLNTKRNINYRSFKPILRLLSVNHTPQAQYWAVWALANLTYVYPEKYCNLLREEGGLDMLLDLAKSSKDSHSKICKLVKLTVQSCIKFDKTEKSDGKDEKMDEIDDSDEDIILVDRP